MTISSVAGMFAYSNDCSLGDGGFLFRLSHFTHIFVYAARLTRIYNLNSGCLQCLKLHRWNKKNPITWSHACNRMQTPKIKIVV
jgi:hypothetical protein